MFGGISEMKWNTFHCILPNPIIDLEAIAIWQ